MARPGPLLLVLGALIALTAASGAGAADAADAAPAADRLSVLAYHPYPDVAGAAGGDPDPLGVPDAEHRGRDRMYAAYGAEWFPTLRVDGVLEHAQARGDTAKSVDRMQAAYAELVDARLAGDTPVTVTVNGTLNATHAEATATFTSRVDVASERVDLHLVLYEDAVRYEGANGIDVHHYTVRHVFPAASVTLDAGTPVSVTRSVAVDANWSRENMGVVAFAQNRDPASVHAEDLEVLQSATHPFRNGNATVQEEKAVLVEMYTAAWCDPCFYGDRALEALVAAYGTAGAGDAAPWEYLRAPTLVEAAFGTVAAGALAVAVWPRRREGAP